MRLLLFDIDGTLLLGGGVGSRAMTRAGRAVLGPGFTLEGIEFAGALDTWIYAEAAQRMAHAEATLRHPEFHEAYLVELARELESGDSRPRILPGVLPLLERLTATPGVTLGLVTGNYARAVPMKLRAVGIEPRLFTLGAFGDEAETRPALVRLALTRWAAQGASPVPERALVIGDTPRDVHCALENGCPCLAVATGAYSADVLAAAGAHAVARDLTDTTALDAWLTDGRT